MSRPPAPEPTDRPAEPAEPAEPAGVDARAAAADRLLPQATVRTSLDRLAGLAARLLSAPSAQVSLLGDQQTVAAGAGLAPGAIGSQQPLEASLCTVTARLAGPLVVDDAAADERVAHLPPVTTGAVGAYLGVPLTTAAGAAVGALCVFGPDAHAWTAYDVALLEQLAGAVMAELELSALASEFEATRLRWDLAIEAAGIGSYDWDLVTDRVDWDERLQGLFGYRPGEFVPHISEAFRRIHPDDQPAVRADIAAAVQTCGTFRSEYRVVLPDGTERWVSARGRAVAGADGSAARLLGTAHDITDAKLADARAAHLLETMATGFVSVDREWRVTYQNAAGAQVTGYTAEELLGQVVWDRFPGLRESEFGRNYEHAVRTGETVEMEAYYEHLDAWLAVRAVPSADGLAIYFLDITARREDQERARAAAERMQLLATVSSELAAAALDTDHAAHRLAELVVPSLADWSVVLLVDDDEQLRDVGWAHVDDARRADVREHARLRAAALQGDDALRRVGPTAGPVVLPGPPADQGQGESMAVSLVGKGRVIGVLELHRDHGRQAFGDDDVETVVEVAGRAGLALDNARLYAMQRSLAEGLQRSLLTAPPEPDHCEIVVRYQPAAEEASVGGDWFDSFVQPDGATVLVIGDVVGHDVEAAAAMGEVRGLLRGIGWYSGAGPATILSGVDAAMRGLQVDTTVTAIVARLEQTRSELADDVARLRWSNAGHPPPIVVEGDGSARFLATEEADLLLGIDPATDRSEWEVTLDRVSTVVLYTDGLVERHGQHLDEGLELLRRTVGELATLPLSELCDELLARLAADADDDVALVAVRLHSHEQPRPAEAGPEIVPPGIEPST